MTDDDECYSELIDGSWIYCGCSDCVQREFDDRESDEEYGVDL